MNKSSSPLPSYRRLHQEKKHQKGKQPQAPDIKLTPTSEQCTHLSSCTLPGFIKIEGVIFCKGCFSHCLGEKNDDATT